MFDDLKKVLFEQSATAACIPNLGAFVSVGEPDEKHRVRVWGCTGLAVFELSTFLDVDEELGREWSPAPGNYGLLDLQQWLWCGGSPNTGLDIAPFERVRAEMKARRYGEPCTEGHMQALSSGLNILRIGMRPNGMLNLAYSPPVRDEVAGAWRLSSQVDDAAVWLMGHRVDR